MSGLFGLLGVASRSMLIVQEGVRTTGHNIANASTPGYSRQVQGVQAALPFPRANGAIGTGVEQTSIDRVTDAFLQRQLVQEDASFGSLEPQVEALAVVEEVLNQQGGGLAAELGALYDAFGDLASATAPGAPAERQALLGAAQSFVDAVSRADERLRDQQRITNRSLVASLDDINAIAQRIAELNGEIVRAEAIAPANDLRDQRDLALRELSRKIETQSFEEPNGSLVVIVAGGAPLVERTTARQLVASPDPTNPFDPGFARVLFDDGVTTRDVTSDIGAGEVGGLLRARDALLPAAIRSLDVLAYNAADSINTVHGAGFGLNGSTGNDFFAPLAVVEDAARALALDAGVAADTDLIAAGGLGAAPGDNANALALAALRDAAAPLFLPGDPPGPPSGPTRTLLDHVSVMVADAGAESRSFQDAAAQGARVLDVLENRREEVSGVSVDEEVTELVRLQAAFQANARIVTVIDRLLQDVLALV